MSMDTDELINVLAQTPPARRPMRLGFAALVMTVLSALATIAVLGLRPELVAVQPPASFWMKTMLLAATLAVSLLALIDSSKPLPRISMRWPVTAVVVLAAACVGREWLTTDYHQILAFFRTPNFPSCLICVTLYGSFGIIALSVLMSHYAPADSKRCAGLIGLAAAAAGALGYSIHCPFDSPTFVVVAYGLPMAGLWLLGRLTLPRHLQW
jgi:hypothetical protein